MTGAAVSPAKSGHSPSLTASTWTALRSPMQPDPKSYLGAAAMLDARPEETMLVAAHEDDLAAARNVGLRTAFVRRPKEFGRPSRYDLPHDRSFDFIAVDFKHLASQLGT